MIKFDTKEQFWSTGIAKNIVSVQDVIDILSALTPPKGRTLSNIPFGFINTKGKPVILFDENKKSILSFGITKAFPVFLDFKRKGAIWFNCTIFISHCFTKTKINYFEFIYVMMVMICCGMC